MPTLVGADLELPYETCDAYESGANNHIGIE